jgi:hypothetical protein
MTADCEHNSVLFWATSNINGLQSATVCHFDYKQYQGLKTVAEGGRNCRATVSVLEKRNHAQPPATAPQLRRNRRATVSFPISATAATVSLRGTVAGAQGLLWLHHTLARPDPLAPRSACAPIRPSRKKLFRAGRPLLYPGAGFAGVSGGSRSRLARTGARHARDTRC